jgi:regulator of replication initiation timing
MLTCVRGSNSHYETDVGETRRAARSRRMGDLKLENENLRLENEELRRRLAFDVAQ